MAIAVDASTPIRWSNTWNVVSGGSITSAAFTAPTDSLLVMAASYDTDNASAPGATSADDTGGLTWARRVERLWNEATAGGGSAIFTARTTSAVSRTARLLGAAGVSWGSGRASAKLYVLTGVDVNGTPVDTVGANNEGGSTTNNLTTSSLTPGANGFLIGVDTDWLVRGTMTSSDLTLDTADYAAQISVASGYKAVTSGVGATANLDAGGALAAQHKWCQIIVREATGGGTGKPWLYYDQMSRNHMHRQRPFARDRHSGLWMPAGPVLRRVA